MTRLATAHLTPDQCRNLQQSVSEELQAAKAWRAAEKLLTRSGDWKGAVGMYKTQVSTYLSLLQYFYCNF
jgi:hypothetical protein